MGSDIKPNGDPHFPVTGAARPDKPIMIVITNQSEALYYTIHTLI